MLPRLLGHYRVFALVRDREQCAFWREHGARPVLADLDQPASLRRIAGLADIVVHLAPPPAADRRGRAGEQRDSRTRWLLAALARGRSLPQRIVYISTTGVYGDCAGALIDETHAVRPSTVRACRRLDAERQLRAFGRRGVVVSILRAPGIYATDRLPIERLRKGSPALRAADDVYTNHIHADDLAAACVAALRRGGGNRVYNVVDDSSLKMADYFDRVADAFALPRPPRLTRAEAGQSLSPVQLSFMRESRRIGNRRLKEELKLRLAYPTVDVGIAAALARRNACSS